MNLHHVLRDAVHDLAAEAADTDLATDLARTAIRRGRLQRRRRVALVTTAGVLAVAILATPFVVVPHRPVGLQPGIATPSITLPSPPTIARTGIAGPIAVHGWIVAAATKVSSDGGSGSSLVYDQSRGQYLQVPYAEVVPAPTGDRAAVLEPGARRRYGILGLVRGDVRWVGENMRLTTSSVPAWSPDGRFLAFLPSATGAGAGVRPELSVRVVEAATGSQQRFDLDLERDYCAGLCQLGWYDANTLSLPHCWRESESGPPPYDSVHLFSALTGEFTRSVDLPGAFTAADDWSTDRRYVVLITGGEALDLPRYVIYDTLTATILRGADSPADTYWISRDQMIVSSPGQLRVVDVAGRTLETIPLPAEFSSYDRVTLMPAPPAPA